jgi:hypothetical protein
MNKQTAFACCSVLLILAACNSSGDSNKTKDTATATIPDTNNVVTNINEPAADIDSSTATKIKVIRENFNRINRITKWSREITKELSETLEGGEATAYMMNEAIEKIATRQYGETFQVITEYYMQNGQLSFVYEKMLRYNRPMYYDSASMKEFGDSEVFDLNKSAITETRSYFENQKMIHQSIKKPAKGGDSNDVSQSEKETLEAFAKLRMLFKK